MSLYHKYRPTSFTQVKGNQETVTTLESMLSDTATCSHSFLLHGPTGCGKTTIARIIAKTLGCPEMIEDEVLGVETPNMDYCELDTADFRGIDTIREIRSNAQYKPINSTCRVWVLDECHKLSTDAMNALLKILEDTPSHVYFILCTTDPVKLLPAIRGRCQQFQVQLLTDAQMTGLLKRICKGEGVQIEQELLQKIAEKSEGHARNAIQILEQVIKTTPEQRQEVIKKIDVQQMQSIELARALFNNASWKTVANILTGLKDQDAEGVRRVVLGYAQAVLLKGADNPRAGLILQEFLEPTYNSGWPQITYAAYSVTKNDENYEH